MPLLLALEACTSGGQGAKPGDPAATGGSAGAAGMPGVGTESCADDGLGVGIPQRIVRLSYAQLANGVQAVLGAEARAAVGATGVVPSAAEREFQPLFTEGPQISSVVLPKTMQVAAAAAGTVIGAPGCTVGDDACAQQVLLQLAQKAYRRSVTPDEQVSLTQLFTELKAHGNTTEQASSLAIEGVLLAAPTLYRTELGANGPGRLSPFEIASQLSYLLLDGPPDPALLEAAQSGALASDDGVRAHVDRLLQTEPVRENLKQVLLAYFQVGNVLADVKDTAIYPEYTSGLQMSMLRESELFVQDALWSGPLGNLLTSPRAFVNKVVAPIYGVTYPGPATDMDDVFLPVDLPLDQRAGLLSRAAVLTMRSRPNETSVVSRGLFVNATVLCATQPPEPPGSILGSVGEQLEDMTLSERQKAESRAATSPCMGCHMYFDAYGLALESFDAIGRYRTSYTRMAGMPAIDSSAQLPAVAGGALVKDSLELAKVLAENGRFSHCLAANLMRYALSDASLLGSEDCGVATVNERFRASDQSFASLLREIAASPTTTTRVAQ